MPPEKAVQSHPELAPAYAAMRAIEAKVEVDGLSGRQRNIVMERARENIAKQIEHGKVPDVQIRETTQTRVEQRGAELSR